MFNLTKNWLFGTTAAAACVLASLAGASSHREAPGITEQPKIDGTDFYMFRSYEPGRGDFITIIANYIPIQAPYGGPNYFTMDPDAIYEIHLDNDGDAIEDITLQFAFQNTLKNNRGIELTIGGKVNPIALRTVGAISATDNANLGEIETYTVTHIAGDRRSGTATQLSHGGGSVFTKPLDNIGTKTIADYAAYANSFIFSDVSLPGCATPARVFVGQRAEAFAVNLGKVFDLVNITPLQGANSEEFPEYNVATPTAGGIVQSRANDDLIGKANVTSIAVELPIACVISSPSEPVIGGWTTASLPQGEVEDPSPTYGATSVYGGAWVQQSRLGMPLVNELVIGLVDKDAFNASEPIQDGNFLDYVTHPTLPALLEVLFGVNAPTNFPRNDLVAGFLTGFAGVNKFSDPNAVASEMLRLNTSIAATARDLQHTLGLIAEDLAAFPNGRLAVGPHGLRKLLCLQRGSPIRPDASWLRPLSTNCCVCDTGEARCSVFRVVR